MGDLLSQLGGSHHATSWLDTIIVLSASFVLGQLLSWLYEATYSGLSYSRKFADTLTLLTCVSAGFSLIAQQSLLAGLGLMAVISVVRFRANVKAPSDLVFIMASATFGLGCGLGVFRVAFTAFFAFAIFALLVNHDSFGSRRRFDAVLRLRAHASGYDAKALEGVLARYCLRSELLASSELAQGQVLEHSYQVKLSRSDERHMLLQDLRQCPQVHDVRLLFQEVNIEY